MKKIFDLDYWRRLQDMLEVKLKRWVYKTIGIHFLVGMIAISFLCYAGVMWAYFGLIAKRNIFTEAVSPVYLNPVHIIVMCFFVFLILYLDKKNIIGNIRKIDNEEVWINANV